MVNETRLNEVFDLVKDICYGIYKGGSGMDIVIDNPHDVDYICFAKPLQKQNLLRRLVKNGFRTTGSIKKHENR